MLMNLLTTFSRIICLVKKVFSEYIMKLPLPPNCCLMQMDESSNDWKHIQYFILLDFGLGYDLSTSFFTDYIDQIGATFYGPMFNHLTSWSLWVCNDEKQVTLHPSGRNDLLAWGRGGGSHNTTAAKKIWTSKSFSIEKKRAKRHKKKYFFGKITLLIIQVCMILCVLRCSIKYVFKYLIHLHLCSENKKTLQTLSTFYPRTFVE